MNRSKIKINNKRTWTCPVFYHTNMDMSCLFIIRTWTCPQLATNITKTVTNVDT